MMLPSMCYADGTLSTEKHSCLLCNWKLYKNIYVGSKKCVAIKMCSMYIIASMQIIEIQIMYKLSLSGHDNEPTINLPLN